MLKELKLKNIKSFEEATLPIGGFTVLLGTNASGKSNVRDVLRFLHGLSRGYKLVEIFAGKYEGGDLIWRGIRGGPNLFVRDGVSSGTVGLLSGGPRKLQFEITLREVRGKPTRVYDETLRADGASLYSTRNEDNQRTNMGPKFLRVYLKRGGDYKRNHTEDCLSDEAVLTQVPEFYLKRNDDGIRVVREGVDNLSQALMQMRFLDLSPDTMREPAFVGQQVLGDRGENLSSVLQQLVESQSKERDILEWLKVLTPMDVAALEFEKDSRGRVSLVLLEHDKRRTPAESASDGTLRFLAYLALAFSTETPTTCFVEEIDNGIHPARLQLLVELIESQSKARGLQVIASSHSPAMMNLLSEDTLLNAVLVYRTEESKSSKVKLLRDLPNFELLSKKRQPGVLMETGWFESTVESLEFVEDDK